jgi:hypothetical protein
MGDVCRSMKVAEGTFYRWTKRLGDIGVTELRQLRRRSGLRFVRFADDVRQIKKELGSWPHSYQANLTAVTFAGLIAASVEVAKYASSTATN